MSIYDFTMKDAKGNDVNLSDYKGKVLLIVNTATGCGFTPQYEGLQDLYEKYQEQGLEILDFPCNQFAGQAPGTEEEIVDFCQSRYGVTFRQFAKIEVNGKQNGGCLKGSRRGVTKGPQAPLPGSTGRRSRPSGRPG